jgi:senescence-induced receptor-like serine/threonine-protein kinase
VLLGFGAFGRVYNGFWNGQPVAVKILLHSEAEEAVIDRELDLMMEVSHSNIVSALHCEKMRHEKEVSRARLISSHVAHGVSLQQRGALLLHAHRRLSMAVSVLLSLYALHIGDVPVAGLLLRRRLRAITFPCCRCVLHATY